MSEVLSNYSGSAITAQTVALEIEKRWGRTEVEKYDPFSNCLTYRRWAELDYRVKKGEKAIRSKTFVEKKDELGNTIKKYPKTVCLFYYLQVEKI